MSLTCSTCSWYSWYSDFFKIHQERKKEVFKIQQEREREGGLQNPAREREKEVVVCERRRQGGSIGAVKAVVVSPVGAVGAVGAVCRRVVRGMSVCAAASSVVDVGNTVSAVQDAYMRKEHCILLDSEDKVIGSDTKRNCHRVEHPAFETPHRAFSVFLFNSKNELLLQQRSAVKITFPLVWTNTCCSHPLHVKDELDGEQGVRRAATRKLLDELGIVAADAPPDDFEYLTRIHYKAPSGGGWGEHEIDYILFMRTTRDISIRPNPEEVAAVQYVDRDALRELVREADQEGSGTVLSPWFRLLVRLCV